MTKLITSLVLLILSASLVNAQIVLTGGSGESVPDGSEFVFTKTGESALLDIIASNESETAIDISMVCEEIIGSNGDNLEFCFGSCYWGITQSQVYGPMSLEPGESTQISEIHFKNHDESNNYISYKFSIYEEGNESNAISFTYIYDVSTDAKLSQKSETKVYPIPARNFIIVENASEVIESVELSDIRGEKIFSESVKTYREKLPIENITHGFYFLKINYKTHSQTEKIIIQ